MRTKQHTSDQIKEYRRALSQSVYNLRKIIDAHFTEPVDDDKVLSFLYWKELDILNKLIASPIGSSVLSIDDIEVPRDLMFNKKITPEEIQEVNAANNCIKKALGKVQSMRQEYYSNNLPSQGLEDCELKTLLIKLLEKKNSGNISSGKPKLKNLYFDPKSGILSNSYGKSTQKISGAPRKLLECFFEGGKDLTCKKERVIERMGGEYQHTGARKQLLSLIRGVADIDSIKDRDDKRNVDLYDLIEVKN
ncbi:MAG: hypothetical protein WCG20_01545 [bacterium]